MPQFKPGESKTAKITMSNPKGVAFDYTGFLYIGSAQVAETSFRLNAGEEKVVSFPVTIPSTTGTFPILLYVYSSGQGIGLYRATEDAVIVPRSPPLPPAGQANLYGVVIDTSTGAPLPGVKASIGILGYEFSGIQDTSVNPSDSTGYYVITNCGITGSGITLPGRYRVIFLKNGYQSVGGTIDLVEGNNILNVQLSPITQVELPIAGGALVGVNGRSLSKWGQVQQPYDIGWYDADGNFVLLRSVQQYTAYAELAAPVDIPDLRSMILNIIDRTFLEGTYEIRSWFTPAQPIVQFPCGFSAARGSAGTPASLPAQVNIPVDSIDYGAPELHWVAGQVYDAFIWYTLYPSAGGIIGPNVLIIRNAVRATTTGP